MSPAYAFSPAPPYAFSPAPSYASLPCTGHSTVEYTPRVGSGTGASTATLTKKWQHLTVIFKGQSSEDADAAPTYGRNSIVCGEMGVENPDNVLTITIQLEGRIKLSSSDCGSMTQKIIDERRTVWDVSKSGRCPTVVGFSVAFPMTYTDENRVYRVPPTYKHHYNKNKYSALVFPQNRAQDISNTHCFQASNTPGAPYNSRRMEVMMPTRWRNLVEPIVCQFIIPSVKTFCLSDDIPFHIQLCGSQTSLGLFYGSISPEELQPGKKPRRHHYAAIVRVFLARQIYLDVNGRQSWRTVTVGEGTLRAIPPAPHNENVDAAVVSVDWEGEVRCKNSDVTCASFNVNHLVIKDFIIFALTPANVRASPLLPIQHAHPIRLVTDGWTAHDTAHPEDR